MIFLFQKKIIYLLENTAIDYNILYIEIQCFSERYFKKLELLNRLHSFMDQFVRYIHGKVCSYRVLNIFAQYV